MFGTLSNLSLIVQVLSVIILITTVLTLIIAVFSYIGYKVRQRRRPQQPEEVPDFFRKYAPEVFFAPPAGGPWQGGQVLTAQGAFLAVPGPAQAAPGAVGYAGPRNGQAPAWEGAPATPAGRGDRRDG
ncbi:hypothetical protein L6R50_11995 [Myxococcota bacterium]|nr:hypothetical protein [Myxococcota bacterium]